MLLLLTLSLPAAALEPTFQGSLGVSWWNPGLLAQLYPGLKQPLWNREGSLLFSDTYLRADAVMDVTPAFARVGPRLTFSPAAVLELSGDWVATPYFGNFTSVVGFDNAEAIYDRDALDAAGQGPGFSSRWGGRALLKAKAGPAVLLVGGTARRWSMRYGDGPSGGWYFEPESQLLLARQDTTLAADVVLAAWLDRDPSDPQSLIVGGLLDARAARHSGDRLLRAGPLVVWQKDTHWAYVLTTQLYLVDRVYDGLFPLYVAGQVRYTRL